MEKLKTIFETPLFEVYYRSPYGQSDSREIFSSDLKKSVVGDIFSASEDNCGRGISTKKAKIVFKDDNGVAVLFCYGGSFDSPQATKKPDEVELVWIELK